MAGEAEPRSPVLRGLVQRDSEAKQLYARWWQAKQARAALAGSLQTSRAPGMKPRVRRAALDHIQLCAGVCKTSSSDDEIDQASSCGQATRYACTPGAPHCGVVPAHQSAMHCQACVQHSGMIQATSCALPLVMLSCAWPHVLCSACGQPCDLRAESQMLASHCQGARHVGSRLPAGHRHAVQLQSARDRSSALCSNRNGDANVPEARSASSRARYREFSGFVVLRRRHQKRSYSDAKDVAAHAGGVAATETVPGASPKQGPCSVIRQSVLACGTPRVTAGQSDRLPYFLIGLLLGVCTHRGSSLPASAADLLAGRCTTACGKMLAMWLVHMQMTYSQSVHHANSGQRSNDYGFVAAQHGSERGETGGQLVCNKPLSTLQHGKRSSRDERTQLLCGVHATQAHGTLWGMCTAASQTDDAHVGRLLSLAVQVHTGHAGPEQDKAPGAETPRHLQVISAAWSTGHAHAFQNEQPMSPTAPDTPMTRTAAVATTQTTEQALQDADTQTGCYRMPQDADTQTGTPLSTSWQWPPIALLSQCLF
jgi:hypothetical protein